MNSQDKSTPKIGIVIPIYNVASYLRECLDSVINQTYGNFCAVLVNDGSTDNSKEIALEYVAKDSRFVLIDKENGGQSSARNVGIKYFSGEIESSSQNSTNYTIFPSLQDSTNRVPLSSLQGKAEAIQANNKIDCHESADADFCNNESFLDCHDFATQNLAMTGEGESSLRESRSDSKQSKQNNLHEVKAESYKKYIDCFGQSPRNDGVDSNDNDKYSSLRGSKADEAIHKNEKIDCHESLRDSRNDEMGVDCHDSALLNLVMTAKTIYTNTTHFMPPKIDYIIFLDSDDFWEVDLLEKCVDSALKHNAQIVWFSWKTFYDGIDNPSVNGGGGIHLAWHLWLHTRGRHKQCRLV